MIIPYEHLYVFTKNKKVYYCIQENKTFSEEYRRFLRLIMDGMIDVSLFEHRWFPYKWRIK
jgi:hypothetical protein